MKKLTLVVNPQKSGLKENPEEAKPKRITLDILVKGTALQREHGSPSLDLHLRSTVKLSASQSGPRDPDYQGSYKVFDVKFCPFYTDVPVFATVGLRNISIWRPPTHNEEGVVLLHSLYDRGEPPKSGPTQEALNSCEWNYVNPDQPLFSVTGDSGLIKVFNALSGDEFTTLVGHGIGTVNDLATHPLYPSILASGSLDTSIRIWDLKRCSERAPQSPCIMICGHGQGHKEGILSIAWHAKGRYIVSGGFDQQVCIWTLPDLSPTSSFWEEIANPKRSAQAVRVVHFPHFITSALHSNYVDCVQFYGDLLISKAAEDNTIVLWRIAGFNSMLDPPSNDKAVMTKEYLDTRSGFKEPVASKTEELLESDQPLYERLLEFSVPHSDYFYMRFGLLAPSKSRPNTPAILTFCNGQSKVYFWDLGGLDRGIEDVILGGRKKKNLPETPFRPLKLKAHREFTIPDFKGFHGRGASWSPDGKWCVVAGESTNLQKKEIAAIAIFERRGPEMGDG